MKNFPSCQVSIGTTKTGLIAAFLLAAVYSAQAGTSTWDGGAAVAPWSNGTNWVGDGAPNANDSLVFAGTVQLTATNDYTAGTQFNGITFASGAGAFVLGGNSINLGGNVTNLSTTGVTINLPMAMLQDTTFNTSTGNFTVGGGIGGAGFDLVKTGTGTLTLGTVVSSYTGETKIREGSIGLSFATLAAGATNLINSSSALELGGGGGAAALTVSSRNSAGSNNSQTFSGTTLKSGLSTVTLSRAGTTTTNTMTLDLGALTREANGVLAVVQGTNAALGTNAWVKATGTVNNGILGGWATFGNDWATFSGADMAAYTGYTVLAGAGPTMASGASTNVQVSAGSTGNVTMAASGTTDVNTLQLTDTASRTVDIGTGNTLRLGQNAGVWRTSTDTTSLTITGGKLTAGGTADTAGEIVFNAAGITGDTLNAVNPGIIVESEIADNGSGAVTLIKTGNQVLRLTSAVNSYSGGTYVHQGRIQSTQAGNLGNGGDVTIANGAGIVLAGAGNYANDFYVSGAGNASRSNTGDTTNGTHGAIILNNGANITGTVTLLGNTRISAPTFYGAAGASTGTISGKITGAYNLEMGYTLNIASGAGTITLSNTGNDWTGGLTISGGGSSGNRVMNVVLGASEVIPDGVGFGDVNFNKAGASGGVTFSLNGFDETINGLGSTGTGSIILQNSHASNNSILTVGAGNASGNYGGTIRNSATGTGGTLSLAKKGTGTQELSGTNTYTGTTTVDGGTLLVSGTLTGTSGVTANTGGTFRYDNNATALDRNVTVSGGKFSYNSTTNYAGTLVFNSGTIGGSNISNLNLTIGTGKTMSPGNSTGTMAAGATTWATGGTFLFELNDTTGTAGSTSLGWDLLNAASLDITAGVGEFTIQIASLDNLQAAGSALNFDGTSNYTWLFVDAGATITGFNAAKFIFDETGFVNSTPGTFSVSQGTGVDDDKLYLNYIGVIPEPGTYALLVGGLGVLAFLRRRSKS